MAEAGGDPCGVEYATLVAISDKLVASISQDPSSVGVQLFARGVLSSSRLNANEIVDQVLKKVNAFPGNFKLLLRVFDECPWLKDLAALVRETHQCKIKVAKAIYSYSS